MSSRITETIFGKKGKVLNVYCTAGFPRVESLPEVLAALQRHGADLVEIGMPYSDPLADGPVIQASSAQALAGGMNLSLLFDQLEGIRERIQLPIILMGYLNPVLQYGFEKFCQRAKAVGVDGLILPDLPMHEFDQEYGPVIKKNGLDFIFLVTPETSDQRLRALDSRSSGFLYVVSSSSTTGQQKSMEVQQQYFQRLAQMNLSNPLLIGFGIRDRESFQAACRYGQGAIIGTAYIQAIAQAPDIDKTTQIFLDGILR